MNPHPLDEALALTPLAPDRFAGATHPAWGNLVGPFGGTTAAQMLQAVMLHPDRLGEPVSFTVNLAAAVADGAFEVAAQPVRTNRSTQHWNVTMTQAGDVVTTALAITALRRDTWGAQEAMLPAVPAPADVPLSPKPPVKWPQRYDMRFIEGELPTEWDGRESSTSLSRVWLRDVPPRPLDLLSITSLADVFFPRIWVRRASRVAIGTVSMTIYYHASAAQLAAEGAAYVLGEAQADAYGHGFFDQRARLWSESGLLLASTHQIVYYKE